MKRHVLSALLIALGLVGTAWAGKRYAPVRYPDPPGSQPYYHGEGRRVRPVYQQPLSKPIHANYDPMLDGDMIDGEYIDGDYIDGSCDDCGQCEAPMACSPRDCVRPLDMWARIEYLGWWAEGSRLPALVTSATGAGTGILGDDDTVVLFGTNLVDDDQRDGSRFTLGAWLDDEHCNALELNFFVLEDSSTGFEVTSLGDPLVARPFFNVELQTDAVQTIAAPGESTGGVFITTTSEVHGAELLIKRKIGQGCYRRVDFLYGYRYAGLDENLSIRDELTSIDPTSTVPVGTVVGGLDNFQTFNQFHGGEFGLAMDFYRHRWTLGLVGKLALGNMRQQVTVGGNTFVAVPGQATIQSVGGLLTQPSNIGGFSRDEFAVVPEFQLDVRYCLTRNLELSVGYTFIYYSDVVRPGDQIDTRIDPRQISDPASATALPAFDFVDTDFWIQGINAGLEYKF
jgi:hypothetical protein